MAIKRIPGGKGAAVLRETPEGEGKGIGTVTNYAAIADYAGREAHVALFGEQIVGFKDAKASTAFNYFINPDRVKTNNSTGFWVSAVDKSRLKLTAGATGPVDYTFQLTVTDNDGATDTDTVIVTASNTSTIPVIIRNPAPISVVEGSTATFSVAATGTAPLSYQWYKNAALVSGATQSTYTTPVTSLTDNNDAYHCEVSNVNGVVNTEVAILTVEDDGIVGYWKLDEGTGSTAADSSGKGNNGTLNGTPTWTTGVSSNALDFGGGSDRVIVPDDDTLDIENAITLAAWIKPTTTATQYIIKKARSGAIDGYELSLSSSTGLMFVRFNQATSGNTYRVLTTSSYPTDGLTWLHLAATYDGSTIKIYVNGQLEASLNDSSLTIATNSVDLGIADEDIGLNPFIGVIDEPIVYNVALDDDQILNLYDEHTPFNKLPVANAGVDQSVIESTVVTLDGTNSSDSDGTIASYSWVQIAGPIVTLNNPTTASPTFTAPTVSGSAGKGVAETQSTIYRPGYDTYIISTTAFDPPQVNTAQRFGPHDDFNGYAICLEDDNTLSIKHWRGGVLLSTTPQDEFLLDYLDGSGLSGFKVDPQSMNIYKISYGYLGVAPASFEIHGGANIGWIPFHYIDLTNNNEGLLVIDDPYLPLRYHVESDGVNPISIYSGSWHAGTIGPVRQRVGNDQFSVDEQLDGFSGSGIKPFLSVKNTESFKTKINKIPIDLHKLTASVDGNKIHTLRIYRNATLTGESFAPVDSGSVVEVDNSATDVTGGRLLGTWPLSTVDSLGDGVNFEIGEIRLYPGDIFTLTIETTSASTDLSAGIHWDELK